MAAWAHWPENSAEAFCIALRESGWILPRNSHIGEQRASGFERVNGARLRELKRKSEHRWRENGAKMARERRDPTTTTTSTSPHPHEQIALAPLELPKPPAPAKPARQVDGDDGEALRRFDTGHRRVLGAPYTAAFARDRKLLRGLIHQSGLPRVLEMIDAFWSEQAEPDTDPKILRPVARAKPDVPGFIHQIPNLHKTWRWDSPIGGTNAENRK